METGTYGTGEPADSWAPLRTELMDRSPRPIRRPV